MSQLLFAYSDRYVYTLPEGHKFPIDKYSLVKEQLLYEGTIQENQLFDPELIAEELILLTHSREYWDKIKTKSFSEREIRKIGFPRDNPIDLRSRNSVAGTYQSALNALEIGAGINLAGGTHHAYRDRGEGFSILNDIAISANALLTESKIKKALIIDLDVHQGNGNAVIFREEPRVFTFSMHGKDNYPLKKEESDWDIALPTGTGDDAYLETLGQALPQLFESQQPDIVFYQSGVDVLEGDRLGKLSLSKDGCKMRDQMVLESCHKYHVPVAIVMGGGYHKNLPDLVDAHCNTMRIAMDLFG